MTPAEIDANILARLGAAVVFASNEIPKGFVLDVLKTLIGAFVGAGLAFASNHWFQRRTQTRDDLAAGRRALFTIRSQMDDFVNCRFGIRHAAGVMVEAIGGGAPEWAFARPMGFNLSESNVFDFESLAFLLSTPDGRAAYESLQYVERTYLDLSARLSDYHTSTQELQRTLAPFTQAHADAGWQAMTDHLGPELVGRVRDHQRALMLRLDRDETRYWKAHTLLGDVMTKTFGSDATMSLPKIPHRYKQENLPALPPPLRAFVDAIPNEEAAA